MLLMKYVHVVHVSEHRGKLYGNNDNRISKSYTYLPELACSGFVQFTIQSPSTWGTNSIPQNCCIGD